MVDVRRGTPSRGLAAHVNEQCRAVEVEGRAARPRRRRLPPQHAPVEVDERLHVVGEEQGVISASTATQNLVDRIAAHGMRRRRPRGGPGGYTAAIRAAQLGAKTVCIEQEPELGGTCLRVGCIPTKAWVETAHGLKVADETFAQLGVKVGAPQLDFAAANDWKNAVSKQMTGGVAILLKANGVEWVKGKGAFKDATTIGVEGGEDVTFTSAIVATGSYPVRPPIPGLESPRCVDSTGLLAQTEVPRRLVVLGGGIIGCEFASILQRFGSEVTIVEMLDTLIPQEDADATKELAKQFGKRGIALHLGKQCTKVEERRRRAHRALRRGGDRAGRPHARLRRSRAARGGPRPRAGGRGVRPAQGHRGRRPSPGPPRRTSTRSATAPATGSWRTRRSARGRSQPRTPWGTRP